MRDDVVDGRNIGDASDGRSGADRVTLDGNGDASIQGSVGFGSDRDDHYTFTAGGSGQARITLSGLSDSAYTRLYDASGSEITTTIADNDRDKVLTANLTNGQDYTVKVDPYGSAEARYDLDINGPSGGSPGGGSWQRVRRGARRRG